MDRMAAILRAEGVRHALLSAGSSSVVAVGGGDEGWPIDLRPRRARSAVARVRVSDGAVGSSGAGEQFFEIDGQRYGHVLDPRTGWPASGVLGVSASPATAIAGCASTALPVVRPEIYQTAHPARRPDTVVILVGRSSCNGRGIGTTRGR
jgi:thiamine biosynthesis lipoprotein